MSIAKQLVSTPVADGWFIVIYSTTGEGVHQFVTVVSATVPGSRALGIHNGII